VTATATHTLPATNTPTNTPTPTSTPTNTPTSTPTVAAPVITGGGQAGSTLVFGHGAPNIPIGQLEILLASDDSVLGTGGTDGAGNFINGSRTGIPVTALTAGETIFAADMQHGVNGPQVVVLGGQVPDLNAWGAACLGLSLLILTTVRLRRAAAKSR